MVSWRPVADVEAALKTTLVDSLRALGYKASFLSDNAGTSYFSELAFDRVATEGVGWQFVIRSSLRQGLPIPQLLFNRWHGVGLSTAFGDGTPRRLWRTGFEISVEDNPAPVFVASHTTVLHFPLNLALSEYNSASQLLSLAPAAFLPVLGSEDARRRAAAGGANVFSHRDLYVTRKRTVVREVRDLLLEISEKGYRRSALIVIFADHGEVFKEEGGTGSTTWGRHGMSVEPMSTAVSILVLPPTTNTQQPLTIDSTSTVSLYDIPDIVLRFLTVGRVDGEYSQRRVLTLWAGANLGSGSGDAEDSRSFDYGGIGEQLNALAGGEYVVPRSAIEAMNRASMWGWTDGWRTATVTPTVGAGAILDAYEGLEFIGQWRVPGQKKLCSALPEDFSRLFDSAPEACVQASSDGHQ